MVRKLRLVIADSNESFRACLTMLFRNEGYEIVGATGDGSRALELMLTQHPDIVLADLVLSGADGFALMERAAQMPREYRPEFIMVSGFVSNRIMATAEELGAAYFIQKPCEPEFLLSRVKMFAPGSGNAKGSGEQSFSEALREDENMACSVTEIMREFGFPANIKGYQYLREAILRAVADMGVVNSVTKELYPEVARKFHTTSSCVERAIRHAIEVAWSRGDIDVLQQYFGYTVSDMRGKPTNSEFIARIADRLIMARTAC